MKTETYSPAQIFNTQQRLLVPLFQRPYVWNRELQWEPLWLDLKRLLTRYMSQPEASHQPHFLGAVVLQQLQTSVGEIQQRTIIDGQQRLTTLQLMFDAIHAELELVGAKMPAARLLKLIQNDEAYCTQPEDKFKVWPTNKDRFAFNEVLAAPIPVNYDGLVESKSKMAMGHKYFAESCRAWLVEEGNEKVLERAEVLDKCCRDLFQIVVIDLAITENAQEIFETLNARGAVLSPADLIKNFVFQRLLEAKIDVEKAYEDYWKDFESPFWEQEINYGRVKFQRSSLFINHWLIAKRGEEVLSREIFSTFKNYVLYESKDSMLEILKKLHSAASSYREILENSTVKDGPLDEVSLFAYRLNVMELDVLRPILIHLIDPTESPIEQTQRRKALNVLESWIVRRLLVRGTTKAYNRVVVEMIQEVTKNRCNAGDQLEKYLGAQNSISSYWPDNLEVERVVTDREIYRTVNKSRIRMILEAVEDHERGWVNGDISKSGMWVTRNYFVIEHLMPQSWQSNWPLNEFSEEVREKLVQSFGNLTLLTTKLNGSVSNGPWNLKSDALTKHNVLLINKQIQELGKFGWDEKKIQERTGKLIQTILSIWPVPEGHKSVVVQGSNEEPVRVEVIDLLAAGLVSAGQTLYAKDLKLSGRTAQILEDGRIQVVGKVFNSLSLAGAEVRTRSANGWTFWLVDEKTRKSMADLRDEYRGLVGLDPSEGESEGDEDEVAVQ